MFHQKPQGCPANDNDEEGNDIVQVILLKEILRTLQKIESLVTVLVNNSDDDDKPPMMLHG